MSASGCNTYVCARLLNLLLFKYDVYVCTSTYTYMYISMHIAEYFFLWGFIVFVCSKFPLPLEIQLSTNTPCCLTKVEFEFRNIYWCQDSMSVLKLNFNCKRTFISSCFRLVFFDWKWIILKKFRMLYICYCISKKRLPNTHTRIRTPMPQFSNL